VLIFIDDSGDPGFKLGGGSTPYFVISCVIFDDDLEAERAALEIKTLRRELGLSDNFEFKFSSANKDLRVAFMKRIADINFRVRAIRVDKSKVRLDELKNKKAKFYNYTIKLVLSHCNGTVANANIKLDGTADRTYRREALSYLRRELNKSGDEPLIKKIAFRKSHSNVLIQMADMVAGSINRERQIDKNDSALYISHLRAAGRIQNVWDFPNK
jgi:hypothetical protein